MTRPVSVNTIQTVFTSLAKDSATRIKFGGYIPPYMLGYKEGVKYNKFMWRSEKCIKDLLFTKDAGIRTGKYAVPGLIWIFENSLSMYAYKEWKGLDTMLYKPPFMNVSTDNVCLGTASDYIENRGRQSDFVGTIKAIEDSFWLSKFSHMGTDDTQIKGSFVSMYQKCKTEFPNDYLTACNKSLKKLIDEEFNS